MIDTNKFDTIRIRPRFLEQIRAASSGEVAEPKTINCRTLKREKDGSLLRVHRAQVQLAPVR